MRILVLGAGLVGGPMAIDLAGNADFEVTVADNNSEALDRTARRNNILTTRNGRWRNTKAISSGCASVSGGWTEGRETVVQCDRVDRNDSATQTLSMARTTGHTATSAVRMMGARLLSRKGTMAPDLSGEDATYVRFLPEELAKRGVIYRESKPSGAA